MHYEIPSVHHGCLPYGDVLLMTWWLTSPGHFPWQYFTKWPHLHSNLMDHNGIFNSLCAQSCGNINIYFLTLTWPKWLKYFCMIQTKRVFSSVLISFYNFPINFVYGSALIILFKMMVLCQRGNKPLSKGIWLHHWSNVLDKTLPLIIRCMMLTATP